MALLLVELLVPLRMTHLMALFVALLLMTLPLATLFVLLVVLRTALVG
jgi:hypothetical protein